MVKAHASTLIRRPIERVFGFVADDFHRNYPRWSAEVVEFEAISGGPIRLGWMARQVRIDKGRRTEAVFRVSRYEPSREIAFEGTSQPFTVEYRFEPIQRRTRVLFYFELSRLELMWRPFEGVIRMTMQDSAERLVENIKVLAEEEIPPPGDTLTGHRGPSGPASG